MQTPKLTGTALTRWIVEEVERCERDFLYFADNYLYYTDRDGNEVTFKPGPEQLILLREVEARGQVLNLKARKLGMSTLLCFYAIWLAMFHGTKCALLAHDEKSVKNLVREKFRFPLSQLPSFLTIGRFRVKEDNLETGLFFVGGGSLRVSHNEGAAFRGGDIGFLHISEFAFLQDPEATFAASNNACLAHAPKILESTAKGLGKMHELWYGDNHAWSKLFFPWTTGRMYRRADLTDDVEDMIKTIKSPDNRDKFISYVQEHKLAKSQAAWALVKLSEANFDWVNFHREYPATPELAFTMSSGRVFGLAFHVGRPKQGLMTFAQPKVGEGVILGADSANGFEDGDYQALALMGGTRDRPVLHKTGYFKIQFPDWTAKVREVAAEHSALIICDSGANGTALLESLRRDGYPNIYRRQVFDKKGAKGIEKLGYAITENSRSVLIDHLKRLFGGDKPLMPGPQCPRLQFEINNFVYNPEKVGNREEAGPGAHDDLLFAVALAYHGLGDTAARGSAVPLRVRPKTETEIAVWELLNDRQFDPFEDFDDDGEELRAANAEARAKRADIQGAKYVIPGFGA